MTSSDTNGLPMIGVQKRRAPVELPEEDKVVYRDAHARALSHIDEARRTFHVNGSGATVAVLDTGVRHTHQLFQPDNEQSVISVRHNVTDDNMGVTCDAWDGAGHGTHVAGLVAEVAPAARVVAVKVLPSAHNATANFVDVVRGLQWVVQCRATLGISVVCLALGDDGNHSDWPNTDMDDKAMVVYDRARSLIETLAGHGVPVVAAAGNHYVKRRKPGMFFPAILPECISVGAVYSKDRNAPRYFANEEGTMLPYHNPSARQLMPASARLPRKGRFGTTIFAAGAVVQSAGIRSDKFLTAMEGTSQAAPLVAGVIALAQQHHRNANRGNPHRQPLPTIKQLKQWLTETGTFVHDSHTERPGDPAEHASLPATEVCYPLLDAIQTLTAIPTYRPDAAAAPAICRSPKPETSDNSYRSIAQPDPHQGDPPSMGGGAPSSEQAEPPNAYLTAASPSLVVTVASATAPHEFAAKCSHLLTRPLHDPLARGPNIAVFVADADATIPAGSAAVSIQCGDTAPTADDRRCVVALKNPAQAALRVAVFVASKLCAMVDEEPTTSAQELNIVFTGNAPVLAENVNGALAGAGCSATPLTEKQLFECNRPPHAIIAFEGADVGDTVNVTRQVLWAKERQVPILVVAQHNADAWRYPAYRGHVWVLDGGMGGQAIAQHGIQHTLQALYFRYRARPLVELAEQSIRPEVFVRPPELVDGPKLRGVVLYPDPPLPRAEQQLLRQGYPQLRTTTPTMLHNQVLAEQQLAALRGHHVALSMSFSREAAKGIIGNHFVDLVVGLTRYLLQSGATVRYGGLPPHQPVKDVAGRMSLLNLTKVLVDIAASSPVDPAGTPLVHNYFTGAADTVGGLPSTETTNYVPVAPPADATQYACAKEEVEQRYFAARHYDAMRERIARETTAQVIMGGRVGDFHGRYPGIVQEAYLALCKDNPVFVLGAYGGAAQLVGEALFETTPHRVNEQQLAAESASAPAADQVSYRQRAQFYDATVPDGARYEQGSLDSLLDAIRAKGQSLRTRPDERWLNGLTFEENKRLFRSRQVEEIVALVIRGLHEVTYRPDNQLGRLPVTLYRGSIGDAAVRSEVYLLGCVGGVPLAGPALALPRCLHERIVAAQLKEELNLAPGTHCIISADDGHACFVGLSDPGAPGSSSLDAQADQLASAVERAVIGCLRAGLFSITSVALGSGSFAAEVRDETDLEAADEASIKASIKAVLQGCQRALQKSAPSRHFAGLTLCELQQQRYDKLKRAVLEQQQLATIAEELPPGVVSPPQREPQLVISSHLLDEKIMFRLWGGGSKATVPSVVRAVHSQDQDHLKTNWRGRKIEDLTQACDDLLGKGAPRHDIHEELRLAYSRADALPIVLLCDNGTANLPIEALMLDKGHPARNSGVMRRLAAPVGHRVREQLPREPYAPLSILAVGDPTCDLVGARKEVENLDRHKCNNIHIKTLVGRAASVEAICQELETGKYDVFHYAGHALFDKKRPKLSGLKCSQGLWLTAERLTGLERLPSLAFINACQSAILTQQAPEPTAHVHRGIAEQLLMAGINQYIGANWEVHDHKAIQFSSLLYQQLLAGLTLGSAVSWARKQIAQGTNDWAAYTCYGHHNFRLRPPASSRPKPQPLTER